MNTNKNIIATFEDRFGDTRNIHSTRHGLTVMRRKESANQRLSKAISGHVGNQVRSLRTERGMTMEDLCLRAGLTFGHNAKQRIYEIEKNLRSIGVRFGTVYQLAMALEVEITDLLPSVRQVEAMTGARIAPEARFAMAEVAA